MSTLKDQATHLTDVKGYYRRETSAPSNPQTGDMYYESDRHRLNRYTGNNWLGHQFTTTSTSTTTT